MHRTESDNKIIVGGLNQFSDGPPGTTVVAVDVNTLFEEIAYVIEQNGLTLKTVATETNQQLYDAIVAQIAASAAANPQLEIDFDVKNLLINVSGVDALALTADKIQYINSSGVTAVESGISDSWVPSTDIVGDEAGSASQWLQAWRDSNGVMKLTVCEEGAADGTTAGFLDASGNTLFTRGAVAGDYLYNTTDYTSTKITTTPTADGQDIAVDDDIFATGEAYKLVKVTAPSGMGAFVANLGYGYQDAGSDLTNSGYTRPELQNFPQYNGSIAGTNGFAVTNNGGTPADYFSKGTPYQVFESGVIKWRFRFSVYMYADYSSINNYSSITFTFSGLTFAVGGTQPVYCGPIGDTAYYYAVATENANTVVGHFVVQTLHLFHAFGDVELKNKPSFATRS